MMGLADVEDLEGLPQCAYIGDVLADVVITDSAAEPPKTMMGKPSSMEILPLTYFCEFPSLFSDVVIPTFLTVVDTIAGDR